VFLRPDIVVVLLEDTLTTADKTLVAAGKGELVDEMRAEFQAAMRKELVEVVERLMGNTVIAFMSANHLEPDMSAEIFVLTRAA
jgi:uncharacterized protein YbcI